MKQIISSLFLFLIVFSSSILNVRADNIDSSKLSSITVHNQYDNINILDNEVNLFFLASIDSSGKYHFQDNYLDISFDASNMTTSEVSLKAKEIFSYITEAKILSEFTLKTKADGTSSFSNLVPGLYLISVDSKVIGDYRYESLPTLITIPIIENDTYKYDVLVNTKTERKKIEQEITPPNVNGDDEIVPNTLDNNYLYIGLLIISFLIIIGVMIYILRKKGENKSENKE